MLFTTAAVHLVQRTAEKKTLLDKSSKKVRKSWLSVLSCHASVGRRAAIYFLCSHRSMEKFERLSLQKTNCTLLHTLYLSSTNICDAAKYIYKGKICNKWAWFLTNDADSLMCFNHCVNLNHHALMIFVCVCETRVHLGWGSFEFDFSAD